MKNRNRSDMKPQVEGKRLFLGILFLLGGGVACILIPAITLHDLSLIATIILGISFIMLGESYIWQATEGWREKKREKHKNKDIKEQDALNE
jgi:hypothetical protein